MSILIFYILTTVYIPVEDPRNEIIEELSVRGMPVEKYSAVKNYFIAADTDTAKKQGVEKWLIKKLNTPIVKLEFAKDSFNTAKAGLFLPYDSKPIDIVIEPLVKVGKNDIWPGKEFKGSFSADYERAFVRLSNSSMECILGREHFAVGQSSRYNLLLSGYSPPMDGLFLSYNANKFKLSFLVSRLENMVDSEWACSTPPFYGKTIDANRFLILRRLDWMPYKRINIGLSEAVLYGGENKFPDFYYLNPVALTYPYEFTRQDKGRNILWDVDFKLHFTNLTPYGELLIDDWQYEQDPQNKPDIYAFLVGFSSAINKIFLNLEYTRATRWVYTQFYPYQRYLYLGYPIGHPYGNDFDELFSKLTYHLNSDLDLFTSGAFGRKGSGTPNTPWPIHDNPRVPGESFPDNNFLVSPITSYFNLNVGLSITSKYLLPEVQGTLSGEVGIYKSSTKNISPVIQVYLTLGINK